MRRLVLALFVVALPWMCASAAYGLPSSGFVSTASVPQVGLEVRYGPGGGLGTRVSVAASSSTDGLVATFRDLDGGTIQSSSPLCSGSGSSVVTCVSDEPFRQLSVGGGIGNDYVDLRGWSPVSFTAYDTYVHPGLGNDVMLGSPGNDDFEGDLGADVAYGYAGNDFLFGDMGADRLFGGDGDDNLSSGLGPYDALWVDRLDCGAGFDAFHAPAPDVVVRCEFRRW